MTRTRLTTVLATLPLAAVACGTATGSTPEGGPGEPGRPATSDPAWAFTTPRSFADGLLARLDVPAGAQVSAHAPSKALEGLPLAPALNKPPVVVKRFWTVDSPSSEVAAWLKAHPPNGLRVNGADPNASGNGTQATTQNLAYSSRSLPQNIAIGDLYVVVISTGSAHSAVAAYAVSLAQPPRPAVENVPADLSSAVIAWSLAPGGTSVRKELTGAAAEKLVRDFNRLRVDVSPFSPCPLIPQQGGDIVVTFTADGHTWKVDVPACPDIQVKRDGRTLPPLAFGPAFLNDVRRYAGHLPQSGPPRADEVVPLGQPPSGH